MIRFTQMLFFALLIAAMPLVAAAQPVDPEQRPADPPLQRLDEQTLDAVRRASTAAAIQRMLEAIEDEDADRPMVFQPFGQRQVIGTEEVVRRYSWKVVTRPIWDIEYEEVEVLVRTQEEGESYPTLKRVTRRKEVSRKKVGEKQERRLVRDPEGNVEKTETRKVYGPGGPDRLPAGTLGANAIALTAMLQAGVDIQTRRSVDEMADMLAAYVEVVGVPDHTFDLAWMVIAYSHWPTDEHDAMLEKMITKLLLGQATGGEGRGLWGPICVNLDLLRALHVYEHQLAAEVERVKAAAEARANDARLQREAERAQNIYNSLIAYFNFVSPQALRFDRIDRPLKVETDHVDLSPGVVLPGMPFNFYKQFVTDLESTMVAVHALRIAQKFGKLPEKVQVPLTDLRDRPLRQPEPTSAVLARCAAAVSKAQNRDGTFSELNVWQAINQFDQLRLGNLVEETNPPRNTPSQTSRATTIWGLATLHDLRQIVGDRVFDARYGGNYQRAIEAAGPIIDPLLAHAAEVLLDPHVHSRDGAEAEDKQVGPVTTARTLYHLSRIAAEVPVDPAADSHWQRVSDRVDYQLVRTQNDGGRWARGGRLYFAYTSGLRQRLELIRGEQEPEVSRRLKRELNQHLWLVEGPELIASYATLALVDDARPPAVAIVPLSERSSHRSPAWAAARGVFVDRLGFRPRADLLPADAVGEAATKVVLLHADMAVANFADDLPADLAAHLEEGGIIVIDAPHNRALGLWRIATERLFPQTLIPAKLDKTHPIMRAAGNAETGPNVLVDDQSQVRVILLPVGPEKVRSPIALTPDQAGAVVATLVEDHARAEALMRDYPMHLPEGVEPAAARQDAWSQLLAQLIPATEVQPQPAAESPSPVAPTRPAPPAPKRDTPDQIQPDETF